ncbi:hypothetical protein COCON_G00187960 [Conger conger]|uniref:G-protein coupled receptors family 1 profile domain-containing protein n=1 Tax=Conger conger TaxID=82655 RepID=A0A9Q1D373_CONCO|nr:C-X-C chemokine receptor type 5 [Conger conger]KAJ8256644.1 hypothetical protein COCON_G00187960 [Conger conger]
MTYITDALFVEVDSSYFLNYSDPSYNYSLENFELACDRAGEMAAFLSVFQPVVYSLMFLLGVTGNGLLLAVLLRRRSRLRITEVYLFHLALADLLLLFTFPFSMTEHAFGWLFGRFLCVALRFLCSLNFFCGALLLGCISVERYLAVVHAVRSLQGRRPLSAHLSCAAVWLVSALVSAPVCPLLSVDEVRGPDGASRWACRLHDGIKSSNWVLARRVLEHTLGFLLPLAVMSYCYAAVVVALCRSRHRSLEKRGAVRLALLITAAFCLCWLPYNIVALLDTLLMAKEVAPDNCEDLTRANKALAVTQSMGYAHCCLIPLLYAFQGVHFRRELRLLSCFWARGSGRASSSLHSTTRTSWSEGVTTSTKTM